MTPLGLLLRGVLLAAAFAMIRRWERLQRRELARNHESQPTPGPVQRAPWWKRRLS